MPDGAASDALNWLTEGDRIALRRGQQIMGTPIAGAGRITGLEVARKFDSNSADGLGTEEVIHTYARKIKYWDTVALDWVEIGTDTLPLLASGEDISIDKYYSLAGAFWYLSSPNSSIYKLPVANPGSIIDLQSADFKGKIKFKKASMYLWDRKDNDGGSDKTGLYRSWIDKDELSDYTFVSAEAYGTGDGVTATFAHTLAFKAAGPKRSCMYCSVKSATENFVDQRDGTLLGSNGGTGTINYATGAVSVTYGLTVPPAAQAITADYYWEDSTDGNSGSANSGAIADFTSAIPRVAATGFTVRQDDGGFSMENIFTLGDDEYCMHLNKTYRLAVSSDDVSQDNNIYRDRVGIPYFRAADETGDGIIYIDATDVNEPFARTLQINAVSGLAVPKSFSDQIDFSPYRFDKAVFKEYGKYRLLACRSAGSTINDTLFVFNKLWESWDKLDYRVSCLDVYQGALIAGDSGSNNVFTLFSSISDEESNIPNSWTSGDSLIGSEGTKKANRAVLAGLIGPDQNYDFQLSYDEAPFVTVANISGAGPYVDKSQRILIGPNTLGMEMIGGGGDGIEAFHYRREFRINTPNFEKVRYRFVANSIGYCSVSELQFKDIRPKGRRVATKYVG